MLLLAVGLSLAEPRVALGPIIGGGAMAGFSTEVRVAGPLRVEAWMGPRLHLGYTTKMNLMGGLGAAVELGKARVRPAPFVRAGGAIPGPVLKEGLAAVGCDLRFYAGERPHFFSMSPGVGALWKEDEGIAETNPLFYFRLGFHWGVGGGEAAPPPETTPGTDEATPAPPASDTPPTETPAGG